MRFVALILAGVWLSATTVTASARDVLPYVATVFYSLNADGTGHLFASSFNSGAATWTWQACSGVGTTTCAPFASGDSIDTGGVSPGTFFVASSRANQIATSPVWAGTLESSSPPRAYGRLRANAQVTPLPGTWSGGWQSPSSDSMQLAACANPNGTGCTALTKPGFIYSCPAQGAVIDPVFTGWYLRVADEYQQTNAPPPPTVDTVPEIAISPSGSPYGDQVWAPSPTTSVAIIGRILPANMPRVTSCGGPPLPASASPRHPGYRCPPSNQLPGCPVAIVSSSGVAQVWCGLSSCQLVTVVRRGPLTAVIRTHMPLMSTPEDSPAAITIRASRLAHARLGAGPASESVYDHGALLARRKIAIPAATPTTADGPASGAS